MPMSIGRFGISGLEVEQNSILNKNDLLEKKAEVLYIWLLILTSAFSIVYALVDILLNTPDEAFVVSLPVPFSALCYFLIYNKGHKILSKFLTTLFLSFVVFVNCMQEGIQTGIMVFFIPVIIGTQIILPGKNRKYAIIITAINFLLMTFLLLSNGQIRPNHTITGTELRTEWVLNFLGATLATAFEVGFLLLATNKLQDSLIIAGEKMTKKNLELSLALDSNEKKSAQIQEQLEVIKKSEKEARKLSLIATQTKNSVVITDAEGRVEWVNKAFEKVSGWKLEEILGKRPKDFLLKEAKQDPVSALISEKLRQKSFVETTILNYTKEGVPYYNHLEITPLFDEAGNVESFFSIQQDVTAEITARRKLIEEETRKQKLIAKIAIQSQEIEKNNISNELHENINQILAAAKMHLDVYKSKHFDEDSSLKRAYENISHGLQEINKLSHTLAAPFWDVFDLADAVGEMVREYSKYSAVRVEQRNHMDPSIIIPEEIRLVGYRIVQEHLSNVYKHAQAKNLVIDLTSKEDGLYIEITDDGLGFETDQPTTGHGIMKMQSRVKFYSGEMVIHSSIGKGCKLDVFLPVED